MARNVVVTGGSSGIGSKIVRGFQALGDEVTILDRNEPETTNSFVQCDLSDITSIDAAVSKLPERIDVFINAAGVSGLAPIPVVMKVNFYALRYLTESIASRISAGGSVVNVASTSSWYWRDHLEEISAVIAARSNEEIDKVCTEYIHDGYTAYARSKEAVLVWSAVAAQQYLGKFRVNSVSPGPIETPLLADFYEAMGHEELDPLTTRAGGRNGRPEEIANVVIFLASAEAFWVNGTDIPVDHSAEMAEFLAMKNIIAPLGK
jgi:NAD(P)-dependent dehydrogenase (short-subunit alcohol dehydrogenase family)